jgi:RNA polymerase sigma-70 factor (ECF subfamily)
MAGYSRTIGRLIRFLQYPDRSTCRPPQASYNQGVDKQAEVELARALSAGETDAFERFVDHFRTKLFHYSWLMCGKPEDAEEVAQETLLKVFENIDQLREPERVRAWVFRIAKNACLMQRRKSVFAPAHEVSIDELPPTVEVSDAGDPPDSELLRSELRAVMDRIIAELPPPYRAVVLLRDIEELSTDETAQILEVSTDVVKTRLHRARQAMRQKLDCYVYHRCMEDEPSPNPAPLTVEEREELYAVWRSRLPARAL